MIKISFPADIVKLICVVNENTVHYTPCRDVRKDTYKTEVSLC